MSRPSMQRSALCSGLWLALLCHAAKSQAASQLGDLGVSAREAPHVLEEAAC